MDFHKPKIFLSFGSNLGDREKNIKEAISSLKRHQIEVVRCSSFYETKPVLHPEFPEANQLNFINCVAQIKASCTPVDLLEIILKIELSLGRDRSQPGWPPRTIDIDIIAWDDLILNTPELTIPHPRMHLRDFVMKPLAEITTNWKHPVLLKDLHELMSAITANC